MTIPDQENISIGCRFEDQCQCCEIIIKDDQVVITREVDRTKDGYNVSIPLQDFINAAADHGFGKTVRIRGGTVYIPYRGTSMEISILNLKKFIPDLQLLQ